MEQAFQACVKRHYDSLGFSPSGTFLIERNYFSTCTPFQNATYPVICFAAAFGSG